MTFDPADPVKGAPLESYVTAEWLRSVNEAIRFLLSRGGVSGGPGIQATQVGGKTTLKASGLTLPSGGGPPDTDTSPIIETGEGGTIAAGKWVTDAGAYIFDCIPATICIDGVEKSCRLLIALEAPTPPPAP